MSTVSVRVEQRHNEAVLRPTIGSLSPVVVTIDAMYVLTATNRTQETFEYDFSYAMVGELVCLPFVECDCPSCGCRQSWAGLTSRRGTTTVEITEWPDLAADDYRDLVIEHWDEQLDGYSLAEDVDFVAETDSFIEDVQTLGFEYGPGTVLRRIGGMAFVATPTSGNSH